MNQLNITDKNIAIKFANIVAKQISAGAIVLLYGDLGTGKTFLSSEIINLLQKRNIIVTSPTFQLLNIYDAENYNIYHYDLYRLKHLEEIYELGIEDALNGQNITIIEWPEIIEPILPNDVWIIKISFNNNMDRIVETNFNIKFL
jgi:tRNA threonylcarbamoyladenosine biosynthesis protein TsaE